MAAPELPRAGRREPEPRGHVTVLELSQAERQEPEPRGHAAVPELPQAGRWELEPWDTWRSRSYPKLGGGSRSLGTHGHARPPCLLS
jgi:hypothetical protein